MAGYKACQRRKGTDRQGARQEQPSGKLQPEAPLLLNPADQKTPETWPVDGNKVPNQKGKESGSRNQPEPFQSCTEKEMRDREQELKNQHPETRICKCAGLAKYL